MSKCEFWEKIKKNWGDLKITFSMQSRPFSREKRTNPIFGSEFRKWTSGPNHSDHPRQYPCVCDGCRNSISKKFKKNFKKLRWPQSHILYAITTVLTRKMNKSEFWVRIETIGIQCKITLKSKAVPLYDAEWRNVSFTKKFKKLRWPQNHI